jgi:hypothetical protein
LSRRSVTQARRFGPSGKVDLCALALGIGERRETRVPFRDQMADRIRQTTRAAVAATVGGAWTPFPAFGHRYRAKSCGV